MRSKQNEDPEIVCPAPLAHIDAETCARERARARESTCTGEHERARARESTCTGEHVHGSACMGVRAGVGLAFHQ